MCEPGQLLDPCFHFVLHAGIHLQTHTPSDLRHGLQGAYLSEF